MAVSWPISATTTRTPTTILEPARERVRSAVGERSAADASFSRVVCSDAFQVQSGRRGGADLAPDRQPGDGDGRLDALCRVDHDRQDRSIRGPTRPLQPRDRRQDRRRCGARSVTAARPARSPSTSGPHGVVSRPRRAPISRGLRHADHLSQRHERSSPRREPTVDRCHRLQRAGDPVHDHEHAQGVARAVEPILECVVFRGGAPIRRSGATRTRTPSRSRSRSARRTGSRPPR